METFSPWENIWIKLHGVEYKTMRRGFRENLETENTAEASCIRNADTGNGKLKQSMKHDDVAQETAESHDCC